ncbi:Guanosine-diphosphatase [Gonapodya sp. JEL0774]|nr:Guanosine-diphosphatase [Gonapodya sp. JEL0774]
MLDAGSTGSRIHVYRFNFCKLDPTLEEEFFMHVEPGLSAYPDDPARAARSLDNLLEAAMDVVPKEVAGCTPVAVKATAGLRKLGPEKSDAILREVRNRLELEFPFKVLEGDEGVEVMDGKDEGMCVSLSTTKGHCQRGLCGRGVCLGDCQLSYEADRSRDIWATNWFVLDGLRNCGRKCLTFEIATVAIMDLGGGSTQIVFEPNPSFPDTHPAARDHRAEILFGGRRYELYQHSYLGYGLMEARTKIAAGSDKAAGCLPAHAFDDLELPEGSESATTDDTTVALSDFDRCLARTTQHSGLFNKDEECPVHPCSFDGVYMPKIRESFPGEVVAISFFYDRFEKLDLGERVTVADVERWSRDVCGYDEDAEVNRSNGASASRELLPIRALARKNPHFCMDMTYMYALLHKGYDVPSDRTIRVIKKVDGVEMGWCLGASLEIVDSMWSGGASGGVGSEGKGKSAGRHRWIGEQCKAV